MRRAGRAGQVVNLVHLRVERVDDVVDHQVEVLVTQPLFDVAFPARVEVIDHGDLVTFQHQPVGQVGADEPGATRDLRPVRSGQVTPGHVTPARAGRVSRSGRISRSGRVRPGQVRTCRHITAPMSISLAKWMCLLASVVHICGELCLIN